MKKRNWGFTLVELLVAVAIMGLLVGGGIAAYVNFDQRQQVIQAGENVEVFLRAAQKKTAAGEKPVTDCDQFEGYRVKAGAGGNELAMYVVCDGSETKTDSIFLTSGLSFESETEVSFKVLTGGVDAAADFDIVGDGRTYKVGVDSAGAVVGYGLVVNPSPTPSPSPTSCEEVCLYLGYSSFKCRQTPTSCDDNGETHEASGDEFCPDPGRPEDRVTCCCQD